MKTLILRDFDAIDYNEGESCYFSDSPEDETISLCTDGLLAAGFISDSGVCTIKLEISKTYRQGFRKVTLGNPYDEDPYDEDNDIDATVKVVVRGKEQTIKVADNAYKTIKRFGNHAFVKITALERMVLGKGDFGDECFMPKKIPQRKRDRSRKAKANAEIRAALRSAALPPIRKFVPVTSAK